MTKTEKQDFIRSLTDSIATELIIKSGAMPEEWDGHELRVLLAAKFEREISHTMRDKWGRRYRDYQNEVIVRNL